MNPLIVSIKDYNYLKEMKESINYVGHGATCLRDACHITERATNEAKHQLRIGLYLGVYQMFSEQFLSNMHD